MSETTAAGGWCLLCGDTVNTDLMGHLAQEHGTRAEKPRADIMSWSDRVTKVIEALEEIKTGDDVKTQIIQLDEQVIKPLYLVRARLSEMRGKPLQRVTEGN